ncbi:hypothetical protein HYC85_018327 [Camellia sinensis]|uniref:NB-ARC domain-containing protein n=1 Tax=Camellia sinensis TaxID=4442 RepID=A0A7J7GUB9_CAMSI|nr:hypothetical protein HYC85_018327 [Camellia sinensis]
MVVVSQNPDIERIQDQIACTLGFTRLIDPPNEIEKANILKDVKKILVILDDVWAKLNLVVVGIPFGDDHQGCKIIITTRREQVYSSMGMERERINIVHFDVLFEEDSWDLFRKNYGNVVDSNMVNAIANEVCKECGGLPMALVTVGSAMKGKDDPDLWNKAARELRKSVPTNIESVDQQVYRSLKLSYDHLQDEEAKACFLVCYLFPRDFNILIEGLVQYEMGLRLFKNVDTVQEARGRAKSMINNLIDSCLLLVSDERGCIKMHDLVCDVAIVIGSSKYFVRAGCSLKDWPMDCLDQ